MCCTGGCYRIALDTLVAVAQQQVQVQAQVWHSLRLVGCMYMSMGLRFVHLCVDYSPPHPPSRPIPFFHQRSLIGKIALEEDDEQQVE